MPPYNYFKILLHDSVWMAGIMGLVGLSFKIWPRAPRCFHCRKKESFQEIRFIDNPRLRGQSGKSRFVTMRKCLHCEAVYVPKEPRAVSGSAKTGGQNPRVTATAVPSGPILSAAHDDFGIGKPGPVIPDVTA